jgi:hypothetical protein
MFKTRIEPDSMPRDMVEYLNDVARELVITFDEAYGREMATREELARITPSFDEAVRLAKLSPATQKWYDGPACLAYLRREASQVRMRLKTQAFHQFAAFFC